MIIFYLFINKIILEIIDLSCEQELVNSEPTMDTFGPNYPTSNIEYINVLARCPSNCHATQGQIYGLGIHPDISPICLSALADKAISEYGGVISISIFPGLEKYVIKEEDSKQFKLIRIASYFGKTKKSYTVSKVDNVDLVERDIRILDGKGKISNEGRLEIRINGKWGTICNKDNNPYSAKRICKDLGYNDGKWLGRDYERGFCKRFKGQNYCGSDNLKSFYNSLACDTSHNNFNSCTKKDANINDCPHELDSIISCTSTAYDGADLTPNGTIKLVKTIKTQDNIIGRLEAYNNGSYNPICKNGFSTESASVACKQMGYKGGDIIEPDPERKLTKAPNDNSPFTASEVICTGKEKKLFDCNLKLSEIHCTHDSDVVLKCDGNKGDPSGNSQIPGKNAIESHPALGKLNMIKLKVDCNFKGNSPKLRGDPGSVILINCPANCLNLKGSIKGLGLYSFDSNVCHAAIHSGVIHDEKGGSFAYTKVWGQKHYMGVQRNGILSTEFLDKMPFSFTITSINSSWNNMWIAFKENHAGIFLEKSTSVSLTNKSRLRSRQLKKNNNLENNLMSSFLQVKSRTSLRSRKYSATQGLPKPIFEWVEVNPSHTFSDKENGSIDIEEHNVASLTKYQFIIKASMSDFKNKKSYFFSYSGCSGFNIFLNEEDNLVFGDPCNETAQINTEIPFPINEKVIIWAYYDDITLKVAVFNEKSKKPISKVFHKALEINNASAIAIGKKSDGNDGFFFGYIDFVLLYPDEIPFSMIPNIINAINNKNKSPVPDNSRITFDERDCISPCENGPLPGEPGCSEAPKDANPYEDELESDMTKAAKPKEKPRMELNFSIQGVSQVFEQTRKAEQHLNQLVSNAKFGMKQLNDNLDAITNARNAYGTRDPSKKSSKAEQKFYNPTVEPEPINPNLTEQYGTNDPKDQNNIESMIVDCTTNLRDKRFNGSMGRIFRVKCPSCQNVKRPVYGSFIYHPLSSICKAASHAGSLRDNKPGYIMVELTSGKKIFNGSIGHDGSISATFSASQISFKTRKGTSPTVINCTDSPNKEPFSNGNIGQKYVVICPKNCGVYKSEIYGSEVYTDTSSICISAIHAGVMNDLGGEIEFLIDGPQSFYKGTKSFGVLSKHQDSYIRSFKFVGVKSSIFYQFKDDYRGKIFDKYDNFVPAETLHVSNNFWRYEESYLEIAGARKKLGHIKHTGDIKSTIVNAYGSFLVLKNAQWSSGRIKSNFLFNNKKTFALCFKYADANNYYSLEFNPESSRRTLNLMEKKDGAIYILESQSMKLTVNTWYRVEIIMSHDNISIYMQNDAVREKKLYFKRVLDKIVRGTIAFATNGNDDLLINGVEIDDYVPHQNNKSNKNKRSWNNLLKHSNNKAKKLYCQKTYRHEREEIDSCLMPQRFCKLICDEYIPQIENILNFNCYRDCNEKIKSDSNELKVDKTFDPKLHDKVDFLPKGTTMFRPGIVIDRKYKIDDKGRKRLRYYVSYFDDKGVNSTEGIYMTDEKMFKCSAKLNNRPDC